MSPLWFVLRRQLNILLDDTVRAGLSMVEVGEGSVVIGVSRVVSPFRFVLIAKLNILLNYAVRASLSVVEMGEGSVIVRIS